MQILIQMVNITKSRLGVGSSASGGKKKEEELDTAPPYGANKLKGARY